VKDRTRPVTGLASDDASGLRRYGRLWRVSYPVLVTSVATLLLTIVDSVLLGHFSTAALAAVALAAPVYLIGNVVVRGWATATQVLVARRSGAGQLTQVATLTDVGLAVGVALGAIVGVLLLVSAPVVLRLIGADTPVVGQAVGYLRVVAAAAPFAAAMFLLQAAFAGLGFTRVAMVMALLMNAVHMPLAIVLIFGAQLGVVGAALSTVISTAAGAGFLLWYGRRRLPTRLPALRARNLRAGWAVLPRLWAIGWPEMSMLFVGYVVEVVVLALVARIGVIELAAYRVLENVLGLSAMALMAISTGITVLAGQHLGAGNADRAVGVYRAGVVLALPLALLPTLPVLTGPHLVFGLFTTDVHVLGAAASASLAAVLGLLPLAYVFSLVGLLRAAGESRRVMLASFTADFLLLIPLAWLLGLRLGLGLNGIFLAWIAFGIGYWAILHRRYRTGAWRSAAI